MNTRRSSTPLPPGACRANDTGAEEVDFLVQHEGNIILIKVKATTNLQSKSLRTYCGKYSPPIAMRTSLGGFGVANGLYSIPP